MASGTAKATSAIPDLVLRGTTLFYLGLMVVLPIAGAGARGRAARVWRVRGSAPRSLRLARPQAHVGDRARDGRHQRLDRHRDRLGPGPLRLSRARAGQRLDRHAVRGSDDRHRRDAGRAVRSIERRRDDSGPVRLGGDLSSAGNRAGTSVCDLSVRDPERAAGADGAGSRRGRGGRDARRRARGRPFAGSRCRGSGRRS